MRMEYPGTTDQDEQKIRNRLQQRMARFREKFSMVSWRDTAGENNAIRDRVLSRLTPAQFAARGGLGSTRGSTPGSRDSQGRLIPLPGRRARGSAAAGDTTAQVQQSQARTVYAGPSNSSMVDTGFTSVNPQVRRLSESHGGSRISQQDVQTNLGNLNRQQHSRPSSSPKPLLNHRINGDQNTTKGAAHHYHPPTPYTHDAALLPYSESSSAVPRHEGTLPIMDEQGASGAANPGMQADQASTVHPGNRITQQAQNLSYASPSENLQVPDGPSIDEDDGDVESLDTDDNDDLSEEDSDEEPDAEMSLAEEDTRMEPLSNEVCSELKRYLEDDRIRTLKCLDGKISLDELLLGMQRNQDKLKQGIKRAREHASDDDEADYLQTQRAKRTRSGQGAAGSSSQLRPKSQNSIYSGFDNSKPGPSGNFPRQGPLANSARRPTRPVGSAVQRLHSDRRRRPAPKSTTAQKDTNEYPSYPQPHPVIGNEWTVYGFHTDSQQSPYLPQQADGLRGQGLYTNPGQPQRGPEPYQPQQDNGIGASRTNMSTGQPQANHSSRSQHQPGNEQFHSAQNPGIRDVTDDMPPYDQNAPTEGRNSHDPGSSGRRTELNRNENGNVAPSPAYQHFEESTAQDDPFFSDELFNGMLNGHPDNNHVGNMYTHAQQREIDGYYHELMTTHPRPEADTNSPETYMPPPPPVPSVTQVTGSATQPAEGSDLTVGDIAGWDPAWSEFVNFHDVEPLLQAENPDDYKEKSPPGFPES